MTLRSWSRLACCGLTLLGAGSLMPAQVVLRGGQTLDDRVVGVNGQGVVTTPRLAPGVQRVIPWDLVRSVGGEEAEASRAFAARADAAWRARTRLARGDDRLAEPMLAALYEEIKAEDGPLTLRVAEGLLRCRLMRGDQSGAVPVWLAALRLQGADAGLPPDPVGFGGRDGASARVLSAVIDPETGLCPALPPIWASGVEASAARASLRSEEDWGGQAGALARWYARAASLDAGETPAAWSSQEPGGAPEPNAVRLVSIMVLARDPDASVRRAARERLTAGLDDDADTWKEAWRRAALGRSLLMESDAGLRSEGLVHLLHLPARFGRTQPYLAGVAAVEASHELRKRGDKASLGAAVRLVTDLKLSEPFHPALREAGGAGGAGAGAGIGVRP